MTGSGGGSVFALDLPKGYKWPCLCAAIVISQAIVGGWPSIARLELHQHAAIFVTWRFALAAFVLCFICILKDGEVRRPVGVSTLNLVIMGILTWSNAFVFLKAIELLGAFIPSIAETMVPVVTLGLLAAWGVEKIDNKKIAGICCAVCGSMFMVVFEEAEAMEGESSTESVQVTSWGFVFALLDIVCTSGYYVFQKNVLREQGRDVNPCGLVAYSHLIGFVFSLCLALCICPWTVEAWGLNEGTIVSLCYAAIGESVIVFVLLAWVNSVASAAVVAAACTLQPLFAATFQWLVLDESIKVDDIIGGGMIVAGLFMTIWSKFEKGDLDDEEDVQKAMA